MLTNGNVKLTFEATGYAATNLVAESAGSLASPISWGQENSTVITTNATRAFEAQLPQQGSVRFYRVKAME